MIPTLLRLHHYLLHTLRAHPRLGPAHVTQRRRIPPSLLLHRFLNLRITHRPAAAALTAVTVQAPAPGTLGSVQDDWLSMLMAGATRRTTETGKLRAKGLAGFAEKW